MENGPPRSPLETLPLEERYSKLIEAYKKIKNQNGLLKQAVLQVQAPAPLQTPTPHPKKVIVGGLKGS